MGLECHTFTMNFPKGVWFPIIEYNMNNSGTRKGNLTRNLMSMFSSKIPQSVSCLMLNRSSLFHCSRATPEVLHLTFTSVRQSRQFYTSIISISGFTIQAVQLQQRFTGYTSVQQAPNQDNSVHTTEYRLWALK